MHDTAPAGHPVSTVGRSPSGSGVVNRFATIERLTVRQRKKWLEILLSFEFANKYDVFDQAGVAALHVREETRGIGGFLARMFLGPLRPFHAEVFDAASRAVLLRLHRPFRFMFHRLSVADASGVVLGAIQRRWSWIRRKYDIEGPDGRVVARLFGPILRPWTFEILVDDVAVGMIQKKWSGLGKELFTDADNFGVDLARVPTPELKVLAFAATTLIDVVHFERSKG